MISFDHSQYQLLSHGQTTVEDASRRQSDDIQDNVRPRREKSQPKTLLNKILRTKFSGKTRLNKANIAFIVPHVVSSTFWFRFSHTIYFTLPIYCIITHSRTGVLFGLFSEVRFLFFGLFLGLVCRIHFSDEDNTQDEPVIGTRLTKSARNKDTIEPHSLNQNADSLPHIGKNPTFWYPIYSHLAL